MSEKNLFDKFMDTAEGAMGTVEQALAPVGEEEDGNSFQWRSANSEGVWIFHAFQGQNPLCKKEFTIIGDQSVRGGGSTLTCCKCLRMVQELAEEE